MICFFCPIYGSHSEPNYDSLSMIEDTGLTQRSIKALPNVMDVISKYGNNPHNLSPLNYAIDISDFDAAQSLIEAEIGLNSCERLSYRQEKYTYTPAVRLSIMMVHYPYSETAGSLLKLILPKIDLNQMHDNYGIPVTQGQRILICLVETFENSKASEIAEILMRDYGVDPNFTFTKYNRTLIEHASQFSNLENIAILVKYGVNISDFDCFSNFSINIKTPDDYKNFIIYLINNGANPLMISDQDPNMTAIDHLIKNISSMSHEPCPGFKDEIIPFLKTYSPNYDLRMFLHDYHKSKEKTEGLTKFHYALLKGQREIAIKMLEIGDDPNDFPSTGQYPSPIIIAVGNEDAQMVELLIKHNVNLNQLTKHMCPIIKDELISPSTLAVKSNRDAKVLEILVKNGAIAQDTSVDNGFDPLRICISTCDEDKFFAIVNNSQDIDFKAIYSKNSGLLHTTTRKPLSQEDTQKIYRIYNHLVNHGAIQETSTTSALSTAIQQGNMELIELMISSGGDINFTPSDKNYFNSSPIYSAITYSANFNPNDLGNKYLAPPNDPLLLLLNLGVQVDSLPTKQSGVFQTYDHTILNYAMELKANSAVALLLEYGVPIDLKDSHGQTALHIAVNSNNIEGVKLILLFHPDIYIKNSSGLTPIDLALTNDKIEIFNLLINYEINKYL